MHRRRNSIEKYGSCILLEIITEVSGSLLLMYMHLSLVIDALDIFDSLVGELQILFDGNEIFLVHH